METKIVEHARTNNMAPGLARDSGIGPITASLIAATGWHDNGWLVQERAAFLPPGSAWCRGSTRPAGSLVSDVITKLATGRFRRMLVLGATSVVFRAPQWR